MHNVPLPVFSIVTVTYNAAEVLERTIQSILVQTYPHVEYIVVDGGSTDGTMTLLASYRKYIHTMVCEPDKGLYDAMNKGIKLATGDYLCFLNAGDKLHTADTLERMVCSLPEGSLPDVLYGETDIVDGDGHFLHKRRLSAPDTLTWKSFRNGMLVCHQAFFVRRALVEPYDLCYRFSADFDWCIRMMKKATGLHNTRLTVIDYLNEGLTTHHHQASLQERFRIMAKHYGWGCTAIRHVWFVLRALLLP